MEEFSGKMIPGWARIKEAASYSGVKERTLRSCLKVGLKHSRLPSGTILIKLAWIDEYLEGFQETENRVNSIVEETMESLKN
jgi:hypothetical protein